MRAKLCVLAAGVSAVLLASPIDAAVAQGGQDFAVYPAGTDPSDRPFFAYDAAPGDVIEDTLTIANYAETPRTFHIFAADGYNTSDVGTFALRQESEVSEDIGAWTTVGADRWTIPALTQVDIPVQVEVPQDASPGDHVGGVVVVQQPIGDETDEEAFGLSVQRGIGARIYVRVSGPLQPRLAVESIETDRSDPLSPLSSGPATTTFRVANVGNVRLSPTVAFRATGPWGVIEEADLGAIADLLPGSSVAITHEWSGVPAGGKITQSISLTDDQVAYTRDVSFWVVPWWAIALTVVLGALTGLLVRRWRRSRRDLSEFRASMQGTARVALLAAVVTPFLGIGPAGADSPELQVRPDGPVAVGDRLVVSGTGWPDRSNLLVEICGNEGAAGSRDCAVTDGRGAATSPDGRFVVEVPVVRPPAPCPCVVRAWTVTGGATAVTRGLSILSPDGTLPETDTGVDSGSGVATVSSGLLEIDGRLEGGGSLKSWFGGSPERTLVVGVENVGDRRTEATFVSLSWSSRSEESGFIPLLAVDPIEAGMRREYPVDLRFDALTVGEITVQGEVLSGVEGSEFVATTSTYPWGFIALAAPFVAALLVFVARSPWGVALRWGSKVRARRVRVEPEELSVVIQDEMTRAFDEAAVSGAVLNSATAATLARTTTKRVAARAKLKSAARRSLEAEIARTFTAEVENGARVQDDPVSVAAVAAVLAEVMPAHLIARIGQQPTAETTVEECGRLVAEVSAEVMSAVSAELDLTAEDAEALVGRMTEELTAVLV